MTASTTETDKQRWLRARLGELIAAMAPGEPLPAERDLARELGVARMTLRRAVDGMIAESLLVRRQGAGTFVAPAKVAHRLAANSFSADMRARGLHPGSRTLSTSVMPAGVMLAALLEVAPGAQILHVRRLRLADGEPMAVEDLHVPVELVPGLTGDDLENRSYYELLAQRFGHRIASGTQTAEAALTSPDDAAALGIEAGTPAFCFERTCRVEDGRVAEFVRSVYRGDRYRIMVDIFPS
ncbi:GntR family transcriptional regulator [Pseudonocardia sp. TRM90224]|uniref:GntR family transcriptional regulator n=1 Tax=Pseudonocardia sp. TRM90224 TaxID=2812678 RepID=UPI001E595247|nr:GntR family transcriptional regulator [Pseudonocardia sp. TRM90224]